eukprot:snap_masked-scaffold_28-processed-gene-4.8-mRNA-1 protein AED:1.00 eAED:1.00 QI:0/-1/0/0/-1/1/1/0/76
MQKKLPLGQEQEDYLHQRIDHMLKTGIILLNKSLTTAMSLSVIPKKRPKRFRLVVGSRPLNRLIQKADNMLPRIEL